MSLLTPSESHAFQSFLSSLDSSEFSPEWDLQLEIAHQEVQPLQGREALAKATKDLMSLDSVEKWRYCNPPVSQTPQPPVTSSSSSKRSPPRQPNKSNKRPRSSPPSSNDSTANLCSKSLNKPNLLPPLQKQADHVQSEPSPSSSNDSTPNLCANSLNKPKLLSPSQKKANHIQSEQKRRANIRRGYEALCQTIPALREAIQLEEEESSRRGATKKKRARGKVNEDGEKIDGRAGPKSESVVLSKTIEYITDLIDEREALIERLLRARQALPRFHPLLNLDPTSIPLWERKWMGSVQEEADEEDDEDEDDD